VYLGRGRIVRASLDLRGPFVIECLEQQDGRVTVRRTDADGAAHGTVEEHPYFGDHDPGHHVVPVHPAVERAMARHGDVMIARTENPYHELLPAVLAQRVTAGEAVTQWANLCRRWGEKMEVDGMQMHTPPRPEVMARVPYHELHLLGIDRRRADALRNIGRHGERLLAGWRVDKPPHERTRSLELLEGVGQWTAAVAGLAAFGDPDALDVGDFHTKNTVAFALTGRPRGSDQEMCGLLEPYAGERARVVMWLALDGWRAPARGPRKRIVSIARM
jgi:3-methyladenine DNA glycosylase/8-oxoguanine DNA glycosylase